MEHWYCKTGPSLLELSLRKRVRKLRGPKFHKLQEAMWLTLINEIFKFPPCLGPFVK